MKITFTRPDDWHLHLRDDAALVSVLPHSARCFARALIMPNLRPPITSVAQVLAYRQRILQALPAGLDFTPLMTLYLTEEMTPGTLRAAANSGMVYAAKLYPAGATTHSDAGVRQLKRIYPLLETLQDLELPLSIHGEVVDPEIDIFDRERVFIERHLYLLLRTFPALRIVFEHITTAEAVAFVRENPSRLAATITAHHLLYNRNAILAGGIHTHFYCLPVLKRESHRRALIAAAISGEPQFFLGTDSAPHALNNKECACGCAGCFTAPIALELYAEAFEIAGALDRLEGFAAWYGADFYRLPRNTGQIHLIKMPWPVPNYYQFGVERVVPLRAGETLHWRVVT